MVKFNYKYLSLIISFLLIQSTIIPQGLAVTDPKDRLMSGGGAYDGTNYMLTLISSDSSKPYEITTQIIGSGPNLSGPRFNTGKSGSGAKLAFDGTNYLMLWTDPFPFFAGGDQNGWGTLYGQFMSKSGDLVGSTFIITQNINLKFGQGRGSLSFYDGTYFVTYLKGGNHQDVLYGQRINKSGQLVGSPIQISSNYAREHAVSFNGTNYLAAWCDGSGEDKVIYGQFISSAGDLAGNNFVIDGGEANSDNPVSVGNDGSRFFVLFHEQASDNISWNLYGRIVSSSGNVADEKILICDSTKKPILPTCAFDGTDYLVTWVENFTGNTASYIKGRFFSSSGTPINNDFVIFDKVQDMLTMGGVAGYIPGYYILGVTHIGLTAPGYTDVYVMGIEPLVTGIKLKNNNIPTDYSLSQNYPNPFNPATNITFTLPSKSFVSLKVFDITGKEVEVLVSEVLSAGTHIRQLNVGSLPSGIYFYRMQSGSYMGAKKLVILK